MLIIALCGRLLTAIPQTLLEGVCRATAWFVLALPSRRRREAYANLHCAFPNRDQAWRVRTLRASFAQMVETTLFVFALPYLSEKRIRKQITLRPIPESLQAALAERRPLLALMPHFALMEATSIYPYLYGDHSLQVGTIYRPLKSAVVDRWIQQSRQRFGVEMISRKSGFFRAKSILEQKGLVVVLFDQNAGDKGVLSLFMDRIASSTDLPGKLACHAQAHVFALYTRRTGFWQTELCIDPLPQPDDSHTLIASSNAWLENKLKTDESLCAAWLWMHRRWKCQDDEGRRFCLSSKRTMLDRYSDIPRKKRFWIRMPNWLGDVVMAIPLIRALREARPDAEITLIAQPHFVPLLEQWGIAEHIRALPPRGKGYFKTFWDWRKDYPHAVILLTNSLRGDIEAWLTGAPQRFGIVRSGKPRPLINQAWHLPETLNEAETHQLDLWTEFLSHFGLKTLPDRSPLCAPRPPTTGARHFGLICGTENSPEKRWSIEHWRELIQQLLKRPDTARITLFGTPRDRVITDAVCAGIEDPRVINCAGATQLVEFADALRTVDELICNDTGGMHLANALGTPVTVLFGPTNPVRTGPIFTGETRILQPEGCPPTGGSDINEIRPSQVLE